MQHDTTFSVRYLTEETVPIRDIIESLQGVDSVMGEVGKLLPQFVAGLQVQRIEVRVREISQESPLRELFLVALFVAFQDELVRGVTANAEGLTGLDIPANLEAIVTVLALIVVFYGVGAIKDLVTGKVADGPAQRMLDGLVSELAADTGQTPEQIKACLDARYGDKTLLKRVANAASRFFMPSKRQDSAPIEVNDRPIDRDTVRDVPAQYLIDHEADAKPARTFPNITLELHAKDRDHAGRGWAAVPRGISDQRLRLRLMDDVATSELWGREIVRGDVTVIYERVGADMIPKELHLHRVTGAD